MKADIRRACDSLDWKALTLILQNVGFPKKMLGWLTMCFKNPMFSIVVNGTSSEYFQGKD